MKKKIITVTLLIAFSVIGFAQKKGDVEFGINLGLNSSNVTSEYLSSYTGTGVNLGFAADYFFSDSWSLKGKIIYDQKGWDNGLLYVGVNRYNTNYNLNYLTIPVMANWHFGKKKNWNLNFGPYAGFLLSAEETAYNTNVKEFFNTNDFGLNIGIGVKFPLSNKLKLNIEYEAQSGFSDVFKDNNNKRIIGTRGALNVGLNFLMK